MGQGQAGAIRLGGAQPGLEAEFTAEELCWGAAGAPLLEALRLSPQSWHPSPVSGDGEGQDLLHLE